MTLGIGGGLPGLGAGLLLGALLAPAPSGAAAWQRDGDSKEEVFEKTDPYTRGEPEALERAGYVALGTPLLLAEGIKSTDVEEALGMRVLWAETAHFRIGSTLATFRGRGDARDRKQSEQELERLSVRFESFKPPRGRLDPWLRLHLFARRLEQVYEDFERDFGLSESDFPAVGTEPGPMGSGPYLGSPSKFVVLLVEKSSHVARFHQRFLDRALPSSHRDVLAGGVWYLGASAESLREHGWEQESALHCWVAAEQTLNLFDGLRGRGWRAPWWFKQGLAHAASRRIDVRYTLQASGALREGDRDAWKWEPRVAGLVGNDYVPAWERTFRWMRWEDLDGHGHMVAWSRVTWILEHDACNRRTLLLTLTDPVEYPQDPEQRAALQVEVCTRALEQAFGLPLAEIDAAWRRWALKQTARR